MSDIRTVDTIRVANYKVRIAKQEEGDGYNAAVVAHKKDSIGKAVGDIFGNDGEYYAVKDAPIVEDSAKYVAIGKAVEAYLNMEDNDALD